MGAPAWCWTSSRRGTSASSVPSVGDGASRNADQIGGRGDLAPFRWTVCSCCPFHPGEILLEEFLRPARMTQAAFAEKVGWTRPRLNELIRGKRGITADAALDLAAALGTTARLWMNLQATWELDRARKRREVA